ncbi:MAG: porin [Pirellulales bacterium]|nr:porin [Pirellulales bacterium]
MNALRWIALGFAGWFLATTVEQAQAAAPARTLRFVNVRQADPPTDTPAPPATAEPPIGVPESTAPTPTVPAAPATDDEPPLPTLPPPEGVPDEDAPSIDEILDPSPRGNAPIPGLDDERESAPAPATQPRQRSAPASPQTSPYRGDESQSAFVDDYGYDRPWYTDEAGCCRRNGHWLIPPALYSPRGLLGEELASALCFDAWLEQGFTWNPDSPPDRFNAGVGFNDRANEYQMNQLYLTMAKPVCTESCQWDIGGQVDLLYGTDYYFTTALGLETHNNGTQRWNRDYGPRANGAAPLYGLAMPQAFVDVYAPWGYGARFRLGHFYTIIGYETVPAVNNFFYSHSYSKLYGEPFTHTGFLSSYNILPSTAILAGVVRGWDTWEDINNDQGFLGGITWNSPERFASFAYSVYAGQEQNELLGEPNSTMVMFSAILTLRPSECFTYVLQYDRGFQENAAGPQFQNDADWYSIVQYFLRDINPCWAWGCRFEWFRDEEGTRLDTNGNRGDFFECTLGLNWKPNANLLVRPELRIDWSQTKGPLPYDGQSDSNQLLIATDVIYRF